MRGGDVIRFCWIVLFWTALAGPVRAQDGAGGGEDEPDATSAEPSDSGNDSEMETGLVSDLLANPFVASREDFGPLQPGEQEKLLDFVRAHTPRIAEMLERLQSQNPARFDERMHDLAPRLRRLARLYERSPELGEKLLRHADNLDGIKRRLRALPPGDDSALPRKRALEEARRLVRENIGIEAAVLDARIKTLRERRAALVDQEFTRLTTDSTQAAKLPTDMRPLIQKFAATSPGPERDALAATIRARIERDIDRSVAQMNTQAARLRSGIAAETESRLDGLRGKTQRPPAPRRPASRP